LGKTPRNEGGEKNYHFSPFNLYLVGFFDRQGKDEQIEARREGRGGFEGSRQVLLLRKRLR